jgi:hypothetical protein
VSDRVFSGIVSTSVSMPINTYWKAALATSKTGLIGYRACEDLPSPLAYAGDKKVKRFHFSETSADYLMCERP